MNTRIALASVFVVFLVSSCSSPAGRADAPPGGNADAPATADAPPGTPDAPAGRTCGAEIEQPCPTSQYCDFTQNGCGATDELGVCRDRPIGCPDLSVAVPTCGCDGKVYTSECEAYMAGTDLNRYGSCPLEAGMFACGWTQCGLQSHYCRHQLTDDENEPDDFTCIALPACPTQWPTCACLAGEPCGDTCTGNGQTGLTLTCPAE